MWVAIVRGVATAAVAVAIVVARAVARAVAAARWQCPLWRVATV